MSDTGKTTSNGKQHAPDMQLSPGFLEQVIAATTTAVQARLNRPSPFDLKTFEEIEAFAERMKDSDFCPAGFKGKAGDIIIAVMKGKELGLPTIAAVESIAVVNGKSTLYGPAVAGLCMGTGLVEDVKEWFEGEPGSQDFTAYCAVKRRGYPTPFVGFFSIADVKKAHLGRVHELYPRDMLLWRARSRAWNPAFPDVLKGIGIAEIEQEEASRPVWKMPMPERGWETTTGMSPWLAGWVEKMVNEQNAWQWMQHLLGALKECHTREDMLRLGDLDMVRSTLQKAPPEAKQSIDEAFAAADARLATTPEPTPEAPQPPKPRTRAAKPAPAAQSAAAVSEPASEPAQADPQPTEQTGAGSVFDCFLLDEQGDPVGEPHSTIDSFMRAFMGLWDRSPSRLALAEQNADALDICVAPGSELAEMIAAERAGVTDDIPFEEEAAWEPEAVPVPQAAGKPAWAEYCRNMRSALDAVPPTHFLSWLAAQSITLAGAPQSTRLQVTKQNLEYCQRHGIEPPKTANGNGNGHATQAAPPPVEAAKPDKDAGLCSNFCEEIGRLKSAGEVARFTNSLHVATPFKRWERERPELAEQLRGTAELRIADLTNMAG